MTQLFGKDVLSIFLPRPPSLSSLNLRHLSRISPKYVFMIFVRKNDNFHRSGYFLGIFKDIFCKTDKRQVLINERLKLRWILRVVSNLKSVAIWRFTIWRFIIARTAYTWVKTYSSVGCRPGCRNAPTFFFCILWNRLFQFSLLLHTFCSESEAFLPISCSQSPVVFYLGGFGRSEEFNIIL